MASSKLSTLCEKVIEVGWLAAAIITPLFYNLDSRRGFEADKLVLLRSIATVMAAAWVILQIEARRTPRSWSFRSWRTALALGVPTLFFVIAYLLSTLLSIAPRISIFGSYSRLQGAYTTLAYVVIFALIAQTLRTRRQLDRLIGVTILASVPVALYALIQSGGMDPMFGATVAGNRVSATLAGPIYLTAYLGMIFFLTLAKLFRTWNGRQTHWILLAAYGGIALLQGIAMILTQNHSAVIAWLVGVGTFAVLFALITQRQNLARGLIVAGGIIVVVAWIGTASITHFLDLSSNPGDSADVRAMIWQGAVDLIQPHEPIQFADGTPDALNALRPLIGYGPETMYLVFARYLPLELVAQPGYGGDALVGRSHNETWDAIVNGGLLGLLASQILFCGFLLVGLRALGLIATDRERNYFIALCAGLGVAAGAVAWLLAPKYLGIAIPAGTWLALAVYVTQVAWGKARPADNRLGADKILLAALVAGIVAHYVEVQFDFGVAATNLLMWMFFGLIVVGFRTLEEEEETPVTWLGDGVSYGVFVGVMLVTLASELVANRAQAITAGAILQDSFTFPIVALFLLTWGVALVIQLADPAPSARPKTWREVIGESVLFSVIALGAAVGFAVGRANQLAALALPIVLDVQDILTVAQNRLGLFNAYVVAVSLLGALVVLMLVIEAKKPATWMTSRWSVLAALALGAVVGVWCNTINLNSVRADIVYNFAQNLNLNYAIALDQSAIARAPMEDVYYRGLALALAGQAQLADTNSANRFDERTTFDGVMQLNAPQLLALNRNELFSAARATLVRARELNPLNPDLTVALAQTYDQWVTLAPADARGPVVEQASQFYAQALSLRPHDARLWNESAMLDLTFKRDLASAQRKLDESLRIDPRIAETYWDLGQTYAAQNAFAPAIQAYQKYIAQSPSAANLWEAHKNLALLQEQAGDLNSAIREAQTAAKLAPQDAQSQLNEMIARLQAKGAAP